MSVKILRSQNERRNIGEKIMMLFLVLLLVLSAQSLNAFGNEKIEIISFEQHDFTKKYTVEKGIEISDLPLPESIRAVVALNDSEPTDSLIQSEPEKNENEVATSKVTDIPVEWSSEDYDNEIPGSYVFEGSYDEMQYKSKEDIPQVIVEVLDTEEKQISKNSMEADGFGDDESNNLAMDQAMDSFNADSQWKEYLKKQWDESRKQFHWTDTSEMNNVSRRETSEQTASEKNEDNTPEAAQNDPMVYPYVENSGEETIYHVYSVQQLSWAIKNIAGSQGSGKTIAIERNLDFAGYQYNWNLNPKDPPVESLIDITIDGKNHTLYNFGAYNTYFLYSIKNSRLKNMNFVSAKTCMTLENQATGLFAYFEYDLGAAGSSKKPSAVAENIHVMDSMFFGQEKVAVFCEIISAKVDTSTNQRTLYNEYISIKNCSTQNVHTFGRDHIGSLTSIIDNTTVENCFSVSGKSVSYGSHSGGMFSCSDGDIVIRNCFTNNEVYGHKDTGVLIGSARGSSCFYECYASGTVEGNEALGGFIGQAGAGKTDHGGKNYDSRFENCYSTSIIGIRAGGRALGGFAGQVLGSQQGVDSGERHYRTVIFENCYAAGEVGSLDTISKGDRAGDDDTIGGFVGEWHTLIESENQLRARFTNCYYDKQTTAMREFWAQDYDEIKLNLGNISGHTDGDNAPEITGVLTSATNKSGQGLTCKPNPDGNKKREFYGFSELGDNKWNITNRDEGEGRYPELKVFSEASDFGEYNELVRDMSRASTSTVILDTWEEGYEWNDLGIREKDKVSYDRTHEEALEGKSREDHVGYEYTYDTVREIVSDFTVTENTEWERMISGGALTQEHEKDGANEETYRNTILIENGTGTIKKPGMEWYQVNTDADLKKAHRPLRLAAYMEVDGGEDTTVLTGSKYDHREDVKLRMVDKFTDNLVVGSEEHESLYWSEIIKDGYPKTSKYYVKEGADLETDVDVGKNAWLHTEIWRIVENSPKYSVKVTGTGTGENQTIDEQKWNGDLPMYPDNDEDVKYEISYYWMLEDGRYRTSSKTVTVKPGEYDLNVDVYDNENTETKEPRRLYLSAEKDDEEVISLNFKDSTKDHAELLKNIYTTNVTAGWKKRNSLVEVNKVALKMTAPDGSVLGETSVAGIIAEDTNIPIDLTYYYTTVEAVTEREVTEKQEITVNYVIKKTQNEEYYIRFNKLANVPDGKTHIGDSTGIENTEIYINDIQANIDVKLYVTDMTTEGKSELVIQKNLENPAEEEESFVFQVDYLGSNNDQHIRTMYATVTLKPGESFSQAVFPQLEFGRYEIKELDSNWRFGLEQSRLETDNPLEEVSERWVKVDLEEDGKTVIYTNFRKDTPWVSGKNKLTNNMPPLE